MTWRVICAAVLEGLAQLEDASVQAVVTSPPYWGLRDYGHDGQIGLEPSPEAYAERLVEVFRGIRRVLRDDGTVWLNLGDSYNAHPGTRGRESLNVLESFGGYKPGHGLGRTKTLKPKDLVGIPWRVAFALQADGWYLRSDIIWAKPNPMPESVTDRPTKSHEYLFLLSKSPRYYFDADAVREPHMFPHQSRTNPNLGLREATQPGNTLQLRTDHTPENHPAGRNIRSVWNIATEPFPGAHFATFPKKLVEPCVKAGTSERGCCGECGQPFERIVEAFNPRMSPAYQQQSRTPKDEAVRGDERFRTRGDGLAKPGWRDLPPAEYRTKGWATPCGHTGEPVPCVVLDPFAGSGTVGLVSLRLGRSFIGIELSPEYAEMARDRIRSDGPLFNTENEVSA